MMIFKVERQFFGPALLRSFVPILGAKKNKTQIIEVIAIWGCPSIQWPFQEPKWEVPTIYKAYIRPM